MNPEDAMRYIRRAVWRESPQADGGYYDVELSCGHKVVCSMAMLSAGMMCISCIRQNKQPGEAESWMSVFNSHLALLNERVAKLERLCADAHDTCKVPNCPDS